MLPQISRAPIRSKINEELDRIEAQAQEKAVVAAAAAERAEAEAMKKVEEVTNQVEASKA